MCLRVRSRVFSLCLIMISATLPVLAQVSQPNAPGSGNNAQEHQTPTVAEPGQFQPGGPRPLHIVRWRDPHSTVTPFFSLPAHLSYFGGPVISNVQIVQVLYGPGTYDPQIAGVASPTMGNFYSDLTGSGFMDMLSEYNAPATGGTGQTIGHGSFVGLFQIVPSPNNIIGTAVFDFQVQDELLAQIAAGHLPAPVLDAQGNPNTLYMVFFPKDIIIKLGGSQSCDPFGGFCAYHSTTVKTFNGKNVLYGVHPDLSPDSCGVGCGASSIFSNNTAVSSHELAEAITDADVGIATVFGPPLAWVDGNTGEEIGDICEPQTALYTANGTTYNIQLEFSNAANNCILPPATKTPDFSLGAGNVTVAAGGSGSSTITVVPSGGFTGSVTLSVAGLPSGVTASFGTNPTTSTSVLIFKASSTAAAGTSNITVTGTSGTLTHPVLLTLTVGAAQPQQLLGNPGFENGTVTTPWTLSAGVLNNSTAQPPRSGAWDAWLDGYGRTHTDTVVQTVSIPSTITSATLSFWLHIDTAETTNTAANDTLQVQVHNGSGAVLATLATFSNLNAAPGYQQHSFNMIGFKGQTVRIRFVGQENSSRQTSFVIDDTALNVQ